MLTLTCSPDSLEAVWDGFLVSSNHKSHCFPPRGTESDPAWRSPTWWRQTTTDRDGQKGVGKRERKGGEEFEFLQVLHTLPQTWICTGRTSAEEITRPCLSQLSNECTEHGFKACTVGTLSHGHANHGDISSCYWLTSVTDVALQHSLFTSIHQKLCLHEVIKTFLRFWE